MTIHNALAGVAVGNLETAAGWYAKLLGKPGTHPMENLYEWSLPSGGVLQVFQDTQRAGHSSVTLSVEGLEALVSSLEREGVRASQRTSSPAVSTAIVHDPDGNQVVLAEQHSGDVAR